MFTLSWITVVVGSWAASRFIVRRLPVQVRVDGYRSAGMRIGSPSPRGKRQRSRNDVPP